MSEPTNYLAEANALIAEADKDDQEAIAFRKQAFQCNQRAEFKRAQANAIISNTSIRDQHFPRIARDVIAARYHTTVAELQGKSRKQNVAMARQVWCYIVRQRTSLSSPVIGTFINKDHATVLHAINKIKRLQVIESVNIRDCIRTTELLIADYLSQTVEPHIEAA